MPGGGSFYARRRKAQIVAALGGCCSVCGEDRMAVLSLHHRYPDGKTASPDRNFKPWRRSLTPAVWAEIWLCDLLCVTCHMLRHASVVGERTAWDYLRDPT